MFSHKRAMAGNLRHEKLHKTYPCTLVHKAVTDKTSLGTE